MVGRRKQIVVRKDADCVIAMTPAEVTEKLKLSQYKGKTWYVVPCCATSEKGDGLNEGFVRTTNSTSCAMGILTETQSWLSRNVQARAAQKQGHA